MLLSLILGCAAMKERAITDAMDRIWNQGDLTAIDEAYEPELAHEVKRFVEDNRALYPDIKVTLDEVIVKGPWFVTEWTVTGTHRQLNKPVTLKGVSVRRYEGGKFVEETMVYDLKAVYDQLGFRVIPPAGASPFDVTATATSAEATASSVIDASLFPAPSGALIQKEVVIPAARSEVFRAWTTSEGWKKFLGVDSTIELRVGGPFEIYFGSVEEAGKGNRGSEGCQVLAYVPDSSLTYSWNAPPKFEAERAQRTWVTVTFSDAPKGATLVRVQHMGFGTGGQWEEVRAYFEDAWGQVLAAQVESLKASR